MSANVVDIRKPSDPILRCIGAGRDCENERVLIFSFDRSPTDDEMRFLLDVMRRAAVMSRSGAEE